MFRLAGTSFLIAMMPAAAFAHAGHLADLAGHSHWAGLAAVAAAAAIAAAAVKVRGRKDQTTEEEAGQPEEAETEGAT